MIFIVIAAVFYAFAIIFGTVASRHLNTNLSAGIINLLSATIPIAVAIPAITKKSLVSNKFGLLMSLFAGMCIAIFAMALTRSYSLNKVGIVAPLVFGGSILISTILSFVILKEKATITQIIGLLIVMVGLSVIIYSRATGQ